jgi:hypothetical protein
MAPMICGEDKDPDLLEVDVGVDGGDLGLHVAGGRSNGGAEVYAFDSERFQEQDCRAVTRFYVAGFFELRA